MHLISVSIKTISCTYDAACHIYVCLHKNHAGRVCIIGIRTHTISHTPYHTHTHTLKHEVILTEGVHVCTSLCTVILWVYKSYAWTVAEDVYWLELCMCLYYIFAYFLEQLRFQFSPGLALLHSRSFFLPPSLPPPSSLARSLP